MSSGAISRSIAAFVRDGVHDRTDRDQRIALEIHLGDQPLREAGAEQREMDMGRAPAVDVVAPRVGAGLHGAEIIIAVLVGERAPAAAEIRIDRGEIGVVLVPVASGGIGLPEFHQRVGDRLAVLVQHLAVHDDAFTDRLAGLGVVADQIVVEQADIVVAENRAGDFRQRVLQRQQRLGRRARNAGLVARRIGRRVQRAVSLEKLHRPHRRLKRLMHRLGVVFGKLLTHFIRHPPILFLPG